MCSALIVIDVQNFFVNNKTKNLPNKIASFIKKNKFDLVIFTPFVNEKGSAFFRQLNWQKCLASPDIDIHPSLTKFVTEDNLFQKSTYSIFKSSRLVAFLKKNKVTKLFLCGIDTDSCVLASALEAFDLGHKVKVLKNLSLSHSGEPYTKTAFRIIDKNVQKNKI